MTQYPGYPAPGQSGAPQFTPPGNHPTQQIPTGWRPDPYGRPGHAPVPGPPLQPWAGAQPSLPQQRRQRPAVIAMAATMTVAASLQWICVLSFAWLVATAGAASLSTRDVEGALYHMLRRFHLRMLEGLALPLYGFPTVAFVLGFVILAPRWWSRAALTVTGLAALAWSGWWLRGDILWWLPIATYIAVVCLIVWTPGATQWYRQRQG
jgi:hypothetical protein